MSKELVLIIEDTASLALIYEECVRKLGYETKTAPTGAAGCAFLEKEDPLAVLLDLKLPDMKGLDILRTIRSNGKNYAVVVITGQASLNTAVEAMQAGADDFVAKPVDPERLQISLTNAIEKTRLKHIVKTFESTGRDHFQGFIGKAPEMQAAYRIIENASSSRAPVMIMGESGTGKEVAAKAIHTLSNRKHKNFIALNCAAIPHDLLESEIFGHVKGAFTGAIADRDGAARLADGGTLFLDELTEMPVTLQSKLLRFIQEGTFSPVGSGETLHADIRFICATNRNPFEAIQRGILREDLYYRLAVIPLELPPLRDRGEDVLLLATFFLEKATKQENKNFESFSPDARDLLLAHRWPGNVRELENIVRHAVIMNNGTEITAAMLPAMRQSNFLPAAERSIEFLPQNTVIRPMEVREREIIEEAIALCEGNITEAARQLCINPSTIHRKMKLWEKN
ncbi:MAG: response regulator [Alphaproteobacteria bacterium]|nr:response regulator [Alphaproteobacteria bacterium]